jgi:hypothetical protein
MQGAFWFSAPEFGFSDPATGVQPRSSLSLLPPSTRIIVFKL